LKSFEIVFVVVVASVLSSRGMKRKSSSVDDREAKRQEIAQPISFSLESYEDYGGSDEETTPVPPPPPPPPVVRQKQKPGPKPRSSTGFEAFAQQQQSTTALLDKMR
jgi:hypothetical protein